MGDSGRLPYLSHCVECMSASSVNKATQINEHTLKCPECDTAASVVLGDGNIRSADEKDAKKPNKVPICITCGEHLTNTSGCAKCYCEGCDAWCGNCDTCMVCNRCLYPLEEGKQCGRPNRECVHSWCSVEYGHYLVESFNSEIIFNCEKVSSRKKFIRDKLPWLEHIGYFPQRRCVCKEHFEQPRESCKCGGDCFMYCDDGRSD